MTRIGQLADVKNAIVMLQDFDTERFEVDRDREACKVTDGLESDAVVMTALRTPAGAWIIRYNENYFGA